MLPAGVRAGDLQEYNWHGVSLGAKLVQAMYWVMGGAILWGVGILLRRVLGLGGTTPRRSSACLNPEQESFCEAMANEIESQSLILSVSLNEALEELEAGNIENASELLELAEAQWLRLGEILSAVLRNVTEYLPLAHI